MKRMILPVAVFMCLCQTAEARPLTREDTASVGQAVYFYYFRNEAMKKPVPAAPSVYAREVSPIIEVRVLKCSYVAGGSSIEKYYWLKQEPPNLGDLLKSARADNTIREIGPARENCPSDSDQPNEVIVPATRIPPNAPQGMPYEFAAVMDGSLQDVSENALLFLGGMSGILGEKCRLPAASDERSMLGLLSTAADSFLATKRSMGETRVNLSGRIAANALDCESAAAKTTATAIVNWLKRVKSGKTGDGSTFIKSCKQHQQTSTCECLAVAGLGIDTDVNMVRYSETYIRNLMARSPPSAVLIGIQCGVSHY